IALWDVLESCDIIGAIDSSIRNVVYNDIAGLLNAYPNITRVYTTGGKAHELLLKYNKSITNPIIAAASRLPSTSPLNCAARSDDLIAAYSVLKCSQK
ncbi:MAG: DNA-deoxyinosine glycosylase, partial [Clostridiales bacterium]|nr:DNA-deoxyinosine glycosylase [Clostridiales bacterium]